MGLQLGGLASMEKLKQCVAKYEAAKKELDDAAAIVDGALWQIHIGEWGALYLVKGGFRIPASPGDLEILKKVLDDLS